MFDMINHSMEPNVGLSFDGSKFFLYALHDIYEGEELLVCYTNPSEQLEWDEDTAMSTLLTWGIPHLPPNNMCLGRFWQRISFSTAAHHCEQIIVWGGFVRGYRLAPPATTEKK